MGKWTENELTSSQEMSPLLIEQAIANPHAGNCYEVKKTSGLTEISMRRK